MIGPILPNPDPRRQKVDKLVVLVSDPCLEKAWAVAVMFEPDGSTVATIKHKTNEAAAREPVGDHDPATVVAVPDQPSRFTLTHHQNPKTSVQSESGCGPVNPCRQVHTDEGRLVVHQVNARLNRGSVIGQSIAHGSDGPGRRVRRAPRPHVQPLSWNWPVKERESVNCGRCILLSVNHGDHPPELHCGKKNRNAPLHLYGWTGVHSGFTT